jgi:alkylation response protein AidB-like acyl-CoA dehydrogenase
VHVELTEAQRQLRDTVRAFARARIAPAAAEIDRGGQFPRALVGELSELGVLGCFVPERWGGAGFDHVAYALAIEELSAGSAAIGAIVATHASLATWPILVFGSDAQRDRCLPPMARGEWLGCAVGIDPDADAVRANAGSDGWVLNGNQRLVVNAPDAQLGIVLARRAPDGFVACLVETGAPGWEVRRVEATMGIRGARCAEIQLTHMRVPRVNVLADGSDGAAIVARMLGVARIGVAAQAVGIARAAVDGALAYARERRAFGAAIADFQVTQFRLADMVTAVEAARLLTLRAAFLVDRGLPYSKEAAIAKLYAAETAMRLATQAVQLHGGYGYTREFAVERYFRDAQLATLQAGTPDVQRRVIAHRLLAEGSGA